MADGYWTKVVQRTFPGADSVREDWEARTVTFELFSARSPLEIQFRSLAEFGSDAVATASVRADDRYRDQGHLSVAATVTISRVAFPRAPG